MSFLIKQIISLVAQKITGAIFYQKIEEKIIALTIDDVPTPNEVNDKTTRLILNIINEYNQDINNKDEPVKATFFIITSHLNNKIIIEEILSQGHEIGNHGVYDETHVNLTYEEFQEQLNQAHQQLTLNGATSVCWYRPGRGFYNKGMLEILKNREEYIPKFALASMIPLDTFRFTSNPKFTAWYVSHFIFPGSILVLHGGTEERALNTSLALKKILYFAKQKHYKIVTLKELWDLFK